MSKVMKSFICRGCMNPAPSSCCTRIDISASANLELVDNFCYLSDMLSVDGDADAAVEARIRIGLNKFRDAGMVICLGRGADLHIAQLMPLPLTISCASKSRLVLLST